MSGNFTECTDQIPNLYLQQGQLVGALIRTNLQIKYLPLPNAVPDLDQAISNAIITAIENVPHGLLSNIESTTCCSQSRLNMSR